MPSFSRDGGVCRFSTRITTVSTHRNTSLTEEAPSNLVAGVDANFAFYQNIRFNTYYAVSHTSSDRLSLKDESS